jgi:hypothetical protein
LEPSIYPRAKDRSRELLRRTRQEGALDDLGWHLAITERTVPRPPLARGLSIDEYPHVDLVRLVRHIRSDGVLRTREDELLLLMHELGFTRRGQRIVAALTAAQSATG